jgi:hypothetical protein
VPGPCVAAAGLPDDPSAAATQGPGTGDLWERAPEEARRREAAAVWAQMRHLAECLERVLAGGPTS